MSYLRNLIAAAKTDGIDLDKTEAAICGAPAGETLSMWDAIAEAHKKLWGHIACLCLSILVQWDHCGKQRRGEPMAPQNYARALACLIAAPWLIAWGVVVLVRLLIRRLG